MTFDLPELLGIVALEDGKGQRLGPVPHRYPVLHQRLARHVQVLEIVEERTARLPRLQIEQRTHAGEHGGVEPVGLGAPAGGLGEAPGLARVDLDEREACRSQPAFKGAVIGAVGS